MDLSIKKLSRLICKTGYKLKEWPVEFPSKCILCIWVFPSKKTWILILYLACPNHRISGLYITGISQHSIDVIQKNTCKSDSKYRLSSLLTITINYNACVICIRIHRWEWSPTFQTRGCKFFPTFYCLALPQLPSEVYTYNCSIL